LVEKVKRSLEEFEIDDIPSDDKQIMENIEGGDNENLNLNDAPNSNGDDENLVEGQSQGGGGRG